MNSLAPSKPPQTPITTRRITDRSPIGHILDAIDEATEALARCGRAGDGPGYQRWEAEWHRLHDCWDRQDDRQRGKRGRP